MPFPVHPNERRLAAFAFVYAFLLLLAYYILRPIRDEFGASGGISNLPWLFTATLLAMLAVAPAFSALVKRLPRERFIAAAYRFFALNLLVFAALSHTLSGDALLWLGRAFFVWLSVYNLFVVSVFWSLMADVFDAEQSKRLFGLLAAGATLGGLAGASLTAFLVARIDVAGLMLLAVVLLECAVFCARRVLRHAVAAPAARQEIIGGSVWAGLRNTFRSPYLMGIAGFILLYSITSTFLYFQQAEIANTAFTDRAERTAFFARIDMWVNGLTLICQVFLTGHLTKKLGVAVVLCTLPVLSAAGFALLAMFPAVGVFVAVQVGRRVANFAFARPARETLFTRLPREDRYKAKNFIDTAVYRTGDQIGSWGSAGLRALQLDAQAIAWLAVPLCVLWALLAYWLGNARTGHEIQQESGHENQTQST